MKKIKAYCVPSLFSDWYFIGMLILEAAAFFYYFKNYEETHIVYLAIMPFSVWAYIFFRYHETRDEFRECITALRERGIVEQAEADFMISVPQFGDSLRVGKYFLFGKNKGCIVPIDELRSVKRRVVEKKIIDKRDNSLMDTQFIYSIFAEWGGCRANICEIPGRQDLDWEAFTNFLRIKAPNVIVFPDLSYSTKTEYVEIDLDD